LGVRIATSLFCSPVALGNGRLFRIAEAHSRSFSFSNTNSKKVVTYLPRVFSLFVVVLLLKLSPVFRIYFYVTTVLIEALVKYMYYTVNVLFGRSKKFREARAIAEDRTGTRMYTALLFEESKDVLGVRLKKAIGFEFAIDDLKAVKIAGRLLNQFYIRQGFFGVYTCTDKSREPSVMIPLLKN
jgi:hypothetical protein